MEMACAECGCVVDAGERVIVCAEHGCCCADLPARASEDDQRGVDGTAGAHRG